MFRIWQDLPKNRLASYGYTQPDVTVNRRDRSRTVRFTVPPLETRLSIEHAPAFDETHELFYEA
ncbi:MAG: hypothetical protein ACK5T6_11305 [Pirellula sp.]